MNTLTYIHIAQESMSTYCQRPCTKDSAGNLYVLTQSHLQKSTDGGANWTGIDLPTGIMNQDKMAMCIDGEDHIHLFWIGGSGSLWIEVRYSMYNGTTWSDYVNIGHAGLEFNTSTLSDTRGTFYAITGLSCALSKNDKVYVGVQTTHYKFSGEEPQCVWCRVLTLADGTWDWGTVLQYSDGSTIPEVYWYMLDLCATDTNDVVALITYKDPDTGQYLYGTQTIGSSFVQMSDELLDQTTFKSGLVFDTILHVVRWVTDADWTQYTLMDNDVIVYADTGYNALNTTAFYQDKLKVLYDIDIDALYLAEKSGTWTTTASGVRKNYVRSLWSMYPAQCRDVGVAIVQEVDLGTYATWTSLVSFPVVVVPVVHSFPCVFKFQLCHKKI